MRITYPALAASALLALAVQPSMAVGFGRVVNTTVLGQPLDVAVPLSADPTEQITAECVSAEVTIGDSALPVGAVQWRLDPQPNSTGVQWLRVHSSVRVVEPVVSVTVSAGCSFRVQRQFTVFVDPPLSSHEASLPAAADVEAAATAGASKTGTANVAGASMVVGQSAPSHADREAEPARPVSARPQRRRARSAVSNAKTKPPVARAAARKGRPTASAAARVRTATPRLQLERGSAAPAAAVVASAPVAPAVADAAASAAAMLAAAASAASEAERASQEQQQQIAELQRRLEQSQLDTNLSNAKAAKLQARLEAAEANRYSLPWLVAFTAVVAVSLFGLGVLLDRRLARRPRPNSWNVERTHTRPAPSAPRPAQSAAPASHRAPAETEHEVPEALASTGPLMFSTPVPYQPTVPVAEPWTASVVIESPEAEAMVVSGSRRHGDAVRSALPVTAEALIDLQQQAEFFVALGQEDTALDLLDGFTRGAGGACPMPYLMLLDMHQRRGDQAAHGAVRDRYERRFNRASPAWGDVLAPSTSIADHVEEMHRIESVWADPAAAMRLVESLLVHGGTPADAFDLHCLGELQFLYLLARDRSEAGLPDAEPVDLLLPLSQAPARSDASAVDLDLDFLAPQAGPESK